MNILDVTWRVPNAPMFLIGGAILAWAFISGALAFTGSQKSGQPEILPPHRPSEVVEEPTDAPADH